MIDDEERIICIKKGSSVHITRTESFFPPKNDDVTVVQRLCRRQPPRLLKLPTDRNKM